MDENDVRERERIATLEISQKSMHKRLDAFEKRLEDMQKAINNIQSLTVEMQHMRADLNKAVAKIDEIEDKPAKMWSTVVTAVLSAIGGGLAGFFINMLVG